MTAVAPAAHAPDRMFALVPCAGVGRRAAAAIPKQYAPLGDRCVVAHTLHALCQVERLAAVLVVLSPTDDQFEHHCPQFTGWVARCGGPTRAASVKAGLVELQRRGAQRNDWVLVHDAARCLLRAQWVNRLIDACVDDSVGGLLAVPLGDTLKQEVNGRVGATLSRADKWIAQTPQMFRMGTLSDALEAATIDVTDESSAIESTGLAPQLVRGAVENFKITWPEDMDVARRLLAEVPA